MKKRITLTIYGNRSMIGIHTKTVMDADPYSFDDKTKTKRLQSFIKRLNSVVGVQKAEVRKYEVSIERADAFDWNEIVPALLPLVAKFCRYDVYELRIEDQRPTYDHDEDGYRTTRRHLESVDLGVSPNDPYAVDEALNADVNEAVAA